MSQPFPDALLDDLPDNAPGPEARYETREAVALAFVARAAPDPAALARDPAALAGYAQRLTAVSRSTRDSFSGLRTM